MSHDQPARWTASVLTLFPEMFPGPLGGSLAGRALAAGIWGLDVHDIRGFAADKHRSVDDTPAGGGAGSTIPVPLLSKGALVLLALLIAALGLRSRRAIA